MEQTGKNPFTVLSKTKNIAKSEVVSESEVVSKSETATSPRDSGNEIIEFHEKAASIPVASNPRKELSSDVPKIVEMIEKKSDTTTKPDVVQTVSGDLDRHENKSSSQENNGTNNRVMTVQERKMQLLKLTQIADYKPKDQEKDINDVTGKLVKKWKQEEEGKESNLAIPDVMDTSNRRRSTGEATSIVIPMEKAKEDICKLVKGTISTEPVEDKVNNPLVDQKINNQGTQGEQKLKNVPQTIKDDPKILEKTTELIKQVGENNKKLLERHEKMKAEKDTVEICTDDVPNSRPNNDDGKEIDQNGTDLSINGNAILNGKNHEGTTVTEKNENGHDPQANGTISVPNGISFGNSSNEAVMNEHKTQVDGDWQNDKAETVNNVPSDDKMDADVELQKCSAESTTRISSEQQNPDDHPERLNGNTLRVDSPTSTTEIISDAMSKIQNGNPDPAEKISIIEKELESTCFDYAEYRREEATKDPSEFGRYLMSLSDIALQDRQITAKLNNLYFYSSSEEEFEVPKICDPAPIASEEKSEIEDANVSATQTDDSDALQIDIENSVSDVQENSQCQDDRNNQDSVPTTPEEKSNGNSKQDTLPSEEQDAGFDVEDFLEADKLDPNLYSFSPSNRRIISNLLNDVDIFSRAALAILRAERTPVIPNIKFRIPSLPAFEPQLPESIRRVFEEAGHTEPRPPTQQAESSSTEPSEPKLEYIYAPFPSENQSNDEIPSTSDEIYSRMREYNLLQEAGIQDKPDSNEKSPGDLLADEMEKRDSSVPYPSLVDDVFMQMFRTYSKLNDFYDPQFKEAMPDDPDSEEIPDYSKEPMDTEILPKDRRKGIIYPDEPQAPPEQDPPTENPDQDPSPANPQPPQGDPNPSNPSGQNPQPTTPQSAQAEIHDDHLNISEQRDLSKYLRQSDSNLKDQDEASVLVCSNQVSNTLKPLPLIGNEDEPMPMMQEQLKPTRNDVDTAPRPVRNSPIPPEDEQIPDDAIPENPIQPQQPQDEDQDAPPRCRGALTSKQSNKDINTAADSERPKPPCRPSTPTPDNPGITSPEGDDKKPKKPADAASMRDPALNPFLEDEQCVSEDFKQVTGQGPDVSPTSSNDSNESEEKKKIRRRRRTKSLNEPKSPKFKPIYHPGTNNEYASPLYQDDSPDKKFWKKVDKPRENLIVKPSTADKDYHMDIEITSEQKEDENMQVLDIPAPSLPPQEIVVEEIPIQSQNQGENDVVVPSYSDSKGNFDLDQLRRRQGSSDVPNFAGGESIVGIISCTSIVNTQESTESGEGQNPNEQQEEQTVAQGSPNVQLISSNENESGNGNVRGQGSDDEDGDKNTQKRSRKKSPEPPTGSPVIDKEQQIENKENNSNLLNPPDRSFFKNRSKSDDNSPKVDVEGGMISHLSKSNEYDLSTAPERVLNSSSDSSSDYMQPIQRYTDEDVSAVEENQEGDEGVQLKGESIPQTSSSKRKGPPTPDIEGGPSKILVREDNSGQIIPKPNENEVVQPGPSSPVEVLVGRPARITQRRRPVPSESDLSESERGQSVLSESGISEIDDFPEDVSEAGDYANSRRMTRNQAAQIEAYQQQQQQPVDDGPPPTPSIHSMDEPVSPTLLQESHVSSAGYDFGCLIDTSNSKERTETAVSFSRQPPSLADLNLPPDVNYEMETIYCRRVPSRDGSIEVMEVVDPPEPSTSEKRKRSSPAEEAETKKIKTDESERQFIPVKDEDEPMPEINPEEPSDCDKEVEAIMSSQNQNDSLIVGDQETNTSRKITVVMSFDGSFMTRIILHRITKKEPKLPEPKPELESPNSPKPPPKPTRKSVPLQETCSTSSRRNSLRPPKPGGGAGALSSRIEAGNSRRESSGISKQGKVPSKSEVIRPQPKLAEAKPVTATSQASTRTTRLSAGPSKTTPKPTTRSSAPDPRKTGAKPKETTTKKEEDTTKKSTITTRSKSKSPRKSGSFRR